MDSSQSSSSLSAVEELLLKIVKAIVDDGAAVGLEVIPTAAGASFDIHVSPTDTGKLIGRHGHTIQALRTIFASIGAKRHQLIKLDIVDPDTRESLPKSFHRR